MKTNVVRKASVLFYEEQSVGECGLVRVGFMRSFFSIKKTFGFHGVIAV